MSTSGPAYSLHEGKGRTKVSPPSPPLLSWGAGPTGRAGDALPAPPGPELQPTPGLLTRVPPSKPAEAKITQARGEMTWQSWCWLPTHLQCPCTSLPLPNPPKSQTPHFQEVCQAVSSFAPRARPAISVHSARQQILYLRVFIFG